MVKLRTRWGTLVTALVFAGVSALVGFFGAAPAAAAGSSPVARPSVAYYYELVNRHSGKCVDVRGASQANSTAVIQYTCHQGTNQHWKLVSVGGGYYEFVVQHSGKCLDVRGASTANSTAVIQYTCHQGANQEWRLVSVGGAYYELVARHSGKCLDVPRSSTANSVGLIQYTCHQGANQSWGFLNAT